MNLCWVLLNWTLGQISVKFGCKYKHFHSRNLIWKLSSAKWKKFCLGHMVTEIWVNIGSGNSLVSDGTKPSPEVILTHHQRCPVTFTWDMRYISKDMLMNLICTMCLMNKTQTKMQCCWANDINAQSKLIFDASNHAESDFQPMRDVMQSISHKIGKCLCCAYRQVSNISRTISQLLINSRTSLWLSLPNPLKPDVKSRTKM